MPSPLDLLPLRDAEIDRILAEDPDPMRPSASLLCKLGSMIVHTEEARSAEGHAADVLALASLRSDPEVQVWLAQMQTLALVPVRR